MVRGIDNRRQPYSDKEENNRFGLGYGPGWMVRRLGNASCIFFDTEK